MKNILCFGDSNTFGTNPSGGRWTIHERWPGVLSDLLGEEYHIIEEGLGGRTTVFDDALMPDRNGRKHLPMLLRTHRPLDLVVILLGTNDMKHRFSLLPGDIATGAQELGRIVETYDYGAGYPIPRVLLVSPTLIKPGVSANTNWGFTEDAVETSRALSPLFLETADRNGWLFFDAATVAEASDRDKLHMEKIAHRALAEALAPLIRDAL